MLPGFLLALREGLEITLIIGIVLGALRKTGHTELKNTAWAGAASAAVLSLLAALLLNRMGAVLEGTAEEIFEGLTMLLAASVLTWMIFWMQRQSRSLKSEIENSVRQATQQNNRRALFALAFLAVLREGIELALFLTAASQASQTLPTALGALLGLGAAAVLGWALFAATLRLDLRRFFLVTGFLLLLFAAGLVAHGVHELNEAGWIPAIVEQLWDTSLLINEESSLGVMLKALFGYNADPSLTEVLAYWLYLGGITLALLRQPTAQARAQSEVSSGQG